MASDNEASCVSDPNFAVICSFLECFGKSCGISYPDIGKLQEMLEDNHEVSQPLIDLHIKLLRKTRKSVSPEKWEKALIKFCHTYSNQDGWEVERFGYKKVRVAVKVRLLKVLLESQFDLNQKFKNEVNKLSANELRLEPLGRDKTGQSYWFQLDDDCNIRVYREDLDEESWELVAQSREGVVKLIAALSDGETGPPPINEDSNSLEISEKPITDTGQVSTSSPSLEEDAIQENGDLPDPPPQKPSIPTEKHQNGSEKPAEEDSEDEDVSGEEEEEEGEEEEDEEEEEDDEDQTNDEESEEDSSQDSSSTPLPPSPLKKPHPTPEKPPKLKIQEPQPPKPIEIKEHQKPSVIKSIETPVITTSPLKLLNPPDQRPPDRLPELQQPLPISFKQHLDPPEKPKPLPFSLDRPTPSKLPMKPIDKLAANLVRLQSEKLSNEKPGASKLVEKIAENLARSSGIHASVINGDEEKLPQDFCSRSRGIDLSTSPRGWETQHANDHNRPVDFSGMDLSSRKPYRNDIQSREIDLSTRKTKPEIANLPYDARSSLLRNHAMIADLSKRQMSFSGYDVQTGSYHGSRLPGKEEHRLPSYSMLPDPSKLASMRLGKRAFEADEQQEMLKRLRTDLLPIRSSLERKSGLSSAALRREEVGPAIEEPLMMVQGEGSGSDCEAANPLLDHNDNGNDDDEDVGEAIEDVFFFYGEGNGNDCDTGNPGDETSNDNKDSNSNESKAESCSDVSQTKMEESVGSSVKTVVNDCNDEDKINCQVGASGESPRAKFKPTLGVQVFPKSPGASGKRLSRWDVKEPDEKRECDSSIISCEENISNDDDRPVGANGKSESGSSGCKSEEDISSTTNQNSVSSSERVASRYGAVSSGGDEPESSSRNEGREEEVPRFFFGPNCVSYSPLTSGVKKTEGGEALVHAVVSASDTKSEEPVPEPDSVPSAVDSCVSSGQIESLGDGEIGNSGDKSDMTPSTTSEEVPEPSTREEVPEPSTREEVPEPSTREEVPESSDAHVSEDTVTNSEASECRISESGGNVPIESSEACSTVDDEGKGESSAEAEPVEAPEEAPEDEEKMETSAIEEGRREEPETSSSEKEVVLENVIDSTETGSRSGSTRPESPRPSELTEDAVEKIESSLEPAAPSLIDETDAAKPMEPVNIVSVGVIEEKEAEKEGIDADDEKSCSLDQDSNESMVIDDRTSDSNGSGKEAVEEVPEEPLEIESSRENLGEKQTDEEKIPENEGTREVREDPVPEELSLEAPFSSSTKEEDEELDEALEGIEPDLKPEEQSQEADFEIEDLKNVESMDSSEPEEVAPKIEDSKGEKESLDEESRSESVDEEKIMSKEEQSQSKGVLNVEDERSIKEISEKEAPIPSEPPVPSEQKEELPVASMSEEINEISESPPIVDVELEDKPSLVSQASLVANYGSEDSVGAGSDDVFEAEANPIEEPIPEGEEEEEEVIPEAPVPISEVPLPVPEAQSLPEEPIKPQEPKESPEIPEITENSPVAPQTEARTEAPADKNNEEPPKPEEEAIQVDEAPAESPEDMFDSSKPDTPIEIDNQDIEKIAATLNEDDEDEEPLAEEVQQVEISSKTGEKEVQPEESVEKSQLIQTNEPEPEPKPEESLQIIEALPLVNPKLQEVPPKLAPTPIVEEISSNKPEGIISNKPAEIISNKPAEIISNKPEEIISNKPEETISNKSAEIIEIKEHPPPKSSAEPPKPPEPSELPHKSVPEEPLTMNDHIEQFPKKDHDPEGEASILHLSKRPRTEQEPLEPSIKTESLTFRNSALTVDKILNLQTSGPPPPSLEPKLDKVMTDLDSVKPVLEELKPITVNLASVEPQELLKSDIKKEASKRLHVELDPEDLPPLKSRPSNVDCKKEEHMTNDIKPLDQKPLELPQPSESLPKKREFDFKPVEQFPNHLESKPIINEQETFKPSAPVITPMKTSDDSEDSMGIDNECMYEPPVNSIDPLEINEHDLAKTNLENTDPKLGIKLKPVSELQYEGWKLETTDVPAPKVSRKRRNSTHESNSEDGTRAEEDEDENMGGKRIKLRGKRSPDMKLRKSIEESRIVDISSDDEPLASVVEAINAGQEKQANDSKKPKPKAKGKKRKALKKRRPSATKKPEPAERPEDGSEGVKNEDATPAAQKKRKKRKMVLGLEIGIDIVEPGTEQAAGETPVRQSRRIAQIKIKEEADRRRIEDEALNTMKGKKGQKEKKKRKKHKESDEEVVIKEVEKVIKEAKETSDKKKKKKRKKKEAMAKFNEAKPWQSSSGSSSDDEDHEEEEEEEEIESEGSLLFKSDHEFSPESDLEKDAEPEPMRRARTAQKSEEGVVEAEDEYACQKCGKADHPEWILLCDTCDKGWHCSCLRPALMLIPEGDWFCPPCQHNLLLSKLRESLKTYDQHVKKHENEIMRKKRLAYVGISLDNVLPKNEVGRRSSHREIEDDSSESEEDNDEGNSGSATGRVSGSGEDSSTSSSSGTATSSSESSSEEDEPVYQLRERRCANTYKFNEYDDMINAAIQDEVEAVQGAGNQGRGKDISTIVNAEKEEAQADGFEKANEEADEEKEKQSEKDSDKDYQVDKDADVEEDDEEEKKKVKVRKTLGKKRHRKLNSLDISSEDDPESDEDFKGSSSDDEEDYEEQLDSSEDSFAGARRRGKRGDKRPVRRSTRAARRQTYDEDFINDDSDDSDRPKRKKSRSVWDESESEESDNSWRQRKKRSKTSSLPRLRAPVKSKAKKKKKRKRIVQMDSDNQSENENDNENGGEVVETAAVPQAAEAVAEEEAEVPEAEEPEVEAEVKAPEVPQVPEEVPEESVQVPVVPEPKEELAPPYQEPEAPQLPLPLPLPAEIPAEVPIDPSQEPVIPEPLQPALIIEEPEKKDKKKREKGIRRKIIYGGLPEDRPQEDDEPLGRRTRGRKINYQVDAIMSDSEEELKKALRKTEDSEDEFVMHIAEDVKEDPEKDSDSADDEYSPQKNAGSKHKSPKNRRSKKSPGGKGTTIDNGEPKQRKKPGPKPGSKNKPRTSVPGLAGSLAGSGIDVGEGSLSNLASEDLGDLNEEQLAQMMMEDEEYGRRQLELAAIEIAKNKKKEEREAKKLEKARLKALEILAAEQQRDPNAPEGTDGEAPKKKKRGRRSKAEILAEQMRRGADPAMAVLPVNIPAAPVIPMTVNPVNPVNPIMSTLPPTLPGTGLLPSDMDRPEAHLMAGQMMTGLDGHLLNPDGTPMRPKRRGRGKGKKTLAKEAAQAAKTVFPGDPDYKHDDMNVLPTPGSSTSGSAPSTPPAIAVTQGGLPVTQSSNPQPVYPQLPSQQSSVITRMLQSQPISSSAQSFTAAAAAMGQKYFGVPNTTPPMMGPRGSYDLTPRGRIPSPYNSRQPGGPLPPHFAAVRSGTPPMRMRVPGPTQLYHTSHHPMDPSPSGGGPISITSRDRASPLGPGPAMIPPAAGSPLAKGGPTPPPPPYARGGPLARFAENPQISRHPMPPFTTANHSIQQPSPPPNRPGNFSPYHPQPPPNYHYGAYPPPPPMTTADDAAAYQGSPYSTEHFSTQPENPPAPPPSIQPPPPPQPQTTQAPTLTPTPHPPPHPPGPPSAESGPGHGKQYDEEGTGEFGGLVSYFSSQREDDLES